MKNAPTSVAKQLKPKQFIPARLKVFLFMVPLIVYVFTFAYKPLWGLSYAFVSYKPGRDVMDCAFRGLKNFTELFGNPILRRNIFNALQNTLVVQAFGYILYPLPMLFAIFLSEVRSKKFQKITQTLTSLPHFVSWVIMFSLAMAIFGNKGLVNTLLANAGKDPINVLYTDKNIRLTMVLISQWKGLGWSSIVYFAAISGIDQQMYEAAMVDGANRMQKIWYITIPSLMPTFIVLLVLSLGAFLSTGMELFMVFGNAMNLNKLEVLDLYLYNLGLGGGKISFGVAAGILTSIVSLVLFTVANNASKLVRGTTVF